MSLRSASAFLVLLAGCGGATEEQLRARAAFDLDCSESSLRVIEIDEQTSGVRGCGQRATYVQRCQAQKTDCTWVLNSKADASGK
ncbi:MAG TPA: hypothetical protein VGJ91_16560 [Polyangiaceae bacterium]